MTRWTGIVVASSGSAGDDMQSRLPTYLHPIAGRPLVWHSVSALASQEPAPDRVVVVGGAEIAADLFGDITSAPIVVVRHEELGDFDPVLGSDAAGGVVVVEACAPLPPAALAALVASPRGSWLGADADAVAAHLDSRLAPEVLRVPNPLQATRGVLAPAGRMPDADGIVLVRSRSGLARIAARIRDAIVAGHMSGGTTFLLPESVLIDVGVRIGADTVVYPGVVMEGETTVGGETVVGPGCRIINSWIGSGVELKGWNYVSNTSVRNRAILEPYVRRGFD